MFIPKEVGSVNYKKLEKLRTANIDLEFGDVKKHEVLVLQSLDDVFSVFEDLVKNHPYYASSSNVNELDVKGYLKKNFNNVIKKALKNEDYKKLNDVCATVGKVYAPKSYGFWKKNRERFAFSHGLNSFIKQYSFSVLKR